MRNRRTRDSMCLKIGFVVGTNNKMEVVSSSSDVSHEILRQQIKYYFSDYFLNQNKAARNVFEIHQGFTVDQLLNFKRFKTMVSEKETLLTFLETNLHLDWLEYRPQQELLHRTVPFVCDKKYKLKNANKILYLSRLSDGTTMEDVELALAGLKYQAIEIRQYHPDHKIQACLIEFDDTHNANKFYHCVVKKNCRIGSVSPEQMKLQVCKYQSYYTNLEKHRRTTKKARQIQQTLEKLSLNCSNEEESMELDDSGMKKSVQIPFGFPRLVRRRTMIFSNVRSIAYENIRSILNTLGVIFLYRMKTDPSKYYAFFQNRETMNKFHHDLMDDALSDVVLVERDELCNIRLEKQEFELFHQDAAEFDSYVRCVKRFLHSKN